MGRLYILMVCMALLQNFYHLSIDAEASHSVDLKFECISRTLDVGETIVNLCLCLLLLQSVFTNSLPQL